MRNNIKIQFHLLKSRINSNKQSPIYMKLFFHGKSSRISAGHYIHARDWDKKKKKVKGISDQAHAINESLNSLRAQVTMIVNKLVLDGIPFNVHTIVDKLSGKELKNITVPQACDNYIQMMKGLPLEYAKPTLIKYTNTKLRLNEFMRAKYGRVDLFLYELNLDFIREFEVFLKQKFANSQTTCYKHSNQKKKIKIVTRYQQYEGANAIVQRVNEGKIKKGLIWHFQGSGKSLLMLFAAQKLRKLQELGNPTVLIVVDRVDLDTQITATFNTAEVANMETTDSIKDLHDLLEKDSRKIIITMIHKFKEAYSDMNTRDNIIVMVDEAHRTQEGDLGRKMRAALPNAFLFGLTGTPINKADHNTFWAFGAEEDAAGYMSRYTFQESIRDNATLPLHFEPRLPNYHIRKEDLDIAFKELTNDLSEEDRNTLSQKATNMNVFLKSPERVNAIAKDITEHFTKHVEPEGLKAMIVTPDRYACIQYKEQLDKWFPAEASEIVISTSANDDFEFKQRWGMDKDKQEKVVEKFNDPESPLKFLIVTAKLLTGFDSAILQTMYLDKSLKDHTLLQAICRTNRLFPNKTFGRIVDYFGVFDNTAKALVFDEETIKAVITNLQELRNKLPEVMQKCLSHFFNIDRNIVGFEGLQAAQDCINSNEKRDAFAKDFSSLSKLWEAISPDEVLKPFQKDYKWLSQVYTSVRPTSNDNGRLLWHALGAQTTKLIHDHIVVSGIATDMEEMILNEDVIDDLMNKKDPRNAQNLMKILVGRLTKHKGILKFMELSERLEEVRNKAEKGLINSIEFIKDLCQIAKETLQAEKETETTDEQKNAKAALTELFLEMKTDKTPAIVERIVTDIDEIVRIVRFDGWQNSTTGEKEVKRELRKIIWVKYVIKDEELFNRAYEYIKEYY